RRRTWGRATIERLRGALFPHLLVFFDRLELNLGFGAPTASMAVGRIAALARCYLEGLKDLSARLENGMPPAAGIAPGLQRLFMLATGAQYIEKVLWAPVR